MSAEILDTEVVELQFKNGQFVEAVDHSLMYVEKLKNSLSFDSSAFDSLSRAASKIDLSAVASNIESLSDRFSTFGIIGMTAIQRITNEVMTLAGKLGGLLTKPWQQIISGGTSRAQNIAQAKFQLQGIYGKDEAGLAKLNLTMQATSDEILKMTERTEDEIVAMNAADYAVADTAYGLDSAAKAASVLATSGVDVVNFYDELADSSGRARTEMQVALRAISGTAAMANTDYDSIAQIFEKVSGNGRIMTMELRQLSSHGLNAAATLRDYYNELDKTAKLTENDIYEMVRKGKIGFMDFAKAMDSAYGDHAKDANNTFTGAFSNMKFALYKIGADFIGPLREKLIPVLNDVRMSINNVRKSLNFKMKFPFFEEEVSIVELFCNLIKNATERVHEFFVTWNGGQSATEKAMSGFASITGKTYDDIKKIFDEAAKEYGNGADSVKELLEIAESSGADVSSVFKSLADTMGKTEDEIVEMCHNGTVSFEEFSNAMSVAFGNTVADNRISQVANIFKNVLMSFLNFGDAIGSYIGPAIAGIFESFFSGIDGIIGITKAVSDFTSQLIASAETQELIYTLSKRIASIIKTLATVVGRLVKSVFKIAQSLYPLIDFLLSFAVVLADIASRILDVIVNSELFSSVIDGITKLVIGAGYIFINIVRIIFAIVGPLISLVGKFFEVLARGIGSFSLSFLDKIYDSLVNFANAILQGGIIEAVVNALSEMFSRIEEALGNFAISFSGVNDTFNTLSEAFNSLFTSISEFARRTGEKLAEIFNKIKEYFSTHSFGEIITNFINTIRESLILTSLTSITYFFASLTHVVNAFTRQVDVNTFKIFGDTVRTIANGILQFAAAMFVISLIPKEQMWKAAFLFLELAAALAGLLWIYMRFQVKISNIMASKSLLKFNEIFEKLTTGLTAFLKQAGTAMLIASVGALIISLAASIFLFAKGIKALNAIGTEEWATGFKRLAIILGTITGVCAVLIMMANAGDGIGRGGALMGAAIALLAMVGALFLFTKVIQEFQKLKPLENEDGTKRIGNLVGAFIGVGVALTMLTIAIAVIGAQAEHAGFGMMGAAIAMLALMVAVSMFGHVLEQFQQYSFKESVGAFIGIALVMILLVAAITELSSLFTQAETSLTATLKGGIKFNRKTTQFMGVILILMGICSTLEIFAHVAERLTKIGFWPYVGAFLVLAGIFTGLYFLMKVAGSERIKSKGITAITVAILAVAGLMFAIALLPNPAKALVAAVAIGVVLLTLTKSLQILNETNLDWKIIGKIALIMLVVTLYVTLMQFLSNFGDVDKSIKFAIGMGFSLLMLSGVIAAMAGVIKILSTIKKEDFDKGIVTVVALTSFIAIFAALMTVFSGFGDVTNAITYMYGTAVAMWKLIPAIVAMSAVVAILSALKIDQTKLFESSLIIAVLLVSIAGFAALMSQFSTIGDPEKAVAYMAGVAKAMQTMLPTLAIMGLVYGILGKLGPMILVGNAAFAILLASIAGFAALMNLVSSMSSAESGLAYMQQLGVIMRQMAETLILISVVAVLAPMAIVGLASISTVASGFIVFCAILNLLGSIINTALNTVNALISVVKAMIMFSNLLLLINIAGINHLANALSLFAQINMFEVLKVVMLASSLLLIASPFAIIGAMREKIFSGVLALTNILMSLSNLKEYVRIISDIGVSELRRKANELLEVAFAIEQAAGMYHVAGMIEGLLDQEMLRRLALASTFVGLVVAASIRNALGIHSPGEEGETEMDYHVLGMVEGLTDDANVSKLLDGGSELIDGFLPGMEKMAGNAGTLTGTSFIDSLGEIMFNGLAELFENAKGVVEYGWGGIVGMFNEEAGNYYQNLGYNTMFGSDGKTQAEAAAKEAYDHVPTAVQQAYEKAGITDYNKKTGQVNSTGKYDHLLTDLLGDLENSFKNLGDISGITADSLDGVGSSMDGVGGSALKASKDTDELTKKIDNLMEKYEDLWDDAKERANKDLFKGVDDQGDEFLDSVQDIMDQYENIYKSAVERTNDQDLFAEVKENDESFAPETLLNNLEDQVNQVNELNTIIASLSPRIADNNLRAAISNMDVDDLPELRAMYRMNDRQLAKYEEMYQNKVQANQNKIQNELSGSLSQLTGKYTNVATYVATDASTDRLTHNLQAQIDKLNDYNSTVASLMGRIKDVHLREAIAAMGIESLDELKKLNSMTDAELDNYVALYNTKITAEAISIKNELSGQLGSALGESVDIDEFYKAWKEKMDAAASTVANDQATKNVGKSAADNITSGVKEKVDPDEAYQLGKDYVESIARGMADPKAIEYLEGGIDGILSMIKTPLEDTHEEYIQFGKDCIDAIVNGFHAKLPPMSEEFTRAIDEIPDAIVDQLNINLIRFEEYGSELMNQLATGINEGIDADDSKFNLAISTIGTAIIDALNSSDAADFSLVGKRIIDEIIKGMNDVVNSETDRVKAPALRIMAIILGTISIQNQYTDYYDCGKAIAEQIVKGLTDYNFESDVSTISDRITQCFRDKNSRFESVGRYIISGLRSGIANNQSSLLNTVSSLANKVTSAMKTALKIKSPSRVFAEIGKYVDEGFAKGIRDYSGLASEEADGMATGSVSAVQNAINQLSGMLDGSIDVNPVITPTLDLSDVNARSQALANMFNGRQIEVQARADEQQAAMMTQLGNILAEQNAEPRTITFNQTNNSPKALSRTEIYRQTKNGFSQLASALS